MFFNPALFHAAGDNHTENFHRIANLFQVSSAFGRAMETVDREAMCLAIYPELLKVAADLSSIELESILNNTCEGYSFPTNLDTDPPLAGMAPQTQKQLMHLALNEQWSFDEFSQQIHKQTAKRLG
jgi:ectoine hydroxylase-related dioxygenase (phytanoyl-CoA dioxygenase family)